jgi:hypothetical protein
VTGAGLGALLCSAVPAIAGLLLYLYVAELLISHIAALHARTAYLTKWQSPACSALDTARDVSPAPTVGH